MSIRLRLVLLYSGLLTLIIAALCILIFAFYAKNLSDSVTDNLYTRVQQVVRSSVPGRNIFGELTVDLPTADAFSSGSVYVEVLDTSGRVSLLSSNLHNIPLPTSDAAYLAARDDGKETMSEQQSSEGATLRTLTSPLRPSFAGGQIVAVIVVAQSLEPMKADLQRLVQILFASGVFAVVLSVLLGWMMTRRALGPIAAVTDTAHNIEVSQDLSQRIPERKVNDEIGQLTDTFNRMLSRLQSAFGFQQRFVADSSHELRTPLTVIKGNAALLRRLDDPVEREEALRAIENEATRMGRIVDDLLLLAQLDNPTATAVQDSGKLKRTVELDTLLLDVFKQAKVMAGPRTVSLGHEDTATVMGDPDQLKQLLLNLVDNAVKYTPEHGIITLSLFREEGWAIVDVADTGVGISSEDLPHIWERFYRVDKVRSREAGGTGLGLSIVRSIAAAHGGTVAAYSQLGQGSVFRVWLPLALSLNGPTPLLTADDMSTWQEIATPVGATTNRASSADMRG